MASRSRRSLSGHRRLRGRSSRRRTARPRCACARSTSSAAVSSGTRPISLRYIRTGSLVGVFSASASSSACRAGAAPPRPRRLAGLDDLDTLRGEQPEDGVHRLGRQLGGQQGGADLFGGEEAGLLTLRDEVLDLVGLRFSRQGGGGHDGVRHLLSRTAAGQCAPAPATGRSRMSSEGAQVACSRNGRSCCARARGHQLAEQPVVLLRLVDRVDPLQPRLQTA